MDEKTWKKEYYDSVDSISFSAISDDRGRITIFAYIKRKLKIKSDSIISVIIKSLKIKKE